MSQICFVDVSTISALCAVLQNYPLRRPTNSAAKKANGGFIKLRVAITTTKDNLQETVY